MVPLAAVGIINSVSAFCPHRLSEQSPNNSRNLSLILCFRCAQQHRGDRRSLQRGR